MRVQWSFPWLALRTCTIVLPNQLRHCLQMAWSTYKLSMRTLMLWQMLSSVAACQCHMSWSRQVGGCCAAPWAYPNQLLQQACSNALISSTFNMQRPHEVPQYSILSRLCGPCRAVLLRLLNAAPQPPRKPQPRAAPSATPYSTQSTQVTRDRNSLALLGRTHRLKPTCCHPCMDLGDSLLVTR